MRGLAARFPGRVAVRIGYDEGLSHRLFAGADAVLVPSRFEPCGLTQMYGLRYGTVPVVRRVGGLADTVVDAGSVESPAAAGTGFVFDAAQAHALQDALSRAFGSFRQPKAWAALMQRGMAQSLSWDGPALSYMALYERACSERRSSRRSDID